MWVSEEVSANLRQLNVASGIGEECSHVPQVSQIILGTPVSPFLQWLSVIAVYKGTYHNYSPDLKSHYVGPIYLKHLSLVIQWRDLHSLLL